VASHLTVSLGVATLVPQVSVRPEDLVDLADRALYVAKEGGRNRVATSNHLSAEPAPRKPEMR
jgi:PleD family two-component response regulator